MSVNVFANLEMRNTGSSPQHVTMSEQRDIFLEHPEQYECGIDRFSVSKANLPMYENAQTLQIKLIKKSDSSEFTQTVDFTGLVDSDNLMWNYTYFINAVNATIEAVCNDHSIVANYPTISLDPATFIATLDYSLITNFGDLWYLEFNQALYGIFSGFTYADVLEDNDFLRVYTPNTPTTSGGSIYAVETAEAINLSPVDKIQIKSQRMPLVYEYTPSSSGTYSTNQEAIVTDFEFGGANKSPLTSINYTASTGQYRMHSMHPSGNFDTCDLQFYYKTYANNEFKLKVLPSGSCNVKLYFRKHQ